MFYTHACRFESFNFLLFNELKKLFMLPPPDFVSFIFSDDKVENASTEKSSLMSK